VELKNQLQDFLGDFTTSFIDELQGFVQSNLSMLAYDRVVEYVPPTLSAMMPPLPVLPAQKSGSVENESEEKFPKKQKRLSNKS